jgi:sulfoxide reductase heme-binding subunit YedZ
VAVVRVSPVLAAVAQRDPTAYAAWLTARAAGVAALVALTLTVWLGLASAGGLLRRRPHLRQQVGVVHEMLALAAIGALAVHVLALLFDGWLRPSVVEVLVPFAVDHAPVWTGFGQIAGYGVLLLGPSFYVRKRIGATRWRSIHRCTTVAFLLAVGHAIGSGTDGRSAWLLLPVLGGTAVAVVLAAVRARRATQPPSARPAPRRPGPTRRDASVGERAVAARPRRDPLWLEGRPPARGSRQAESCSSRS